MANYKTDFLCTYKWIEVESCIFLSRENKENKVIRDLQDPKAIKYVAPITG